jgi:hypothetical protein
MNKKHANVWVLVLGLLLVFAIPVLANELSSATATVDCTGFTLNVNAFDLSAGTEYTIDYTFTLTCGGTITIVNGSKTFTATSATAMVSTTGNWPTPLTASCTVMGSATLTSSGSMVTITFGGLSTGTLDCTIPLDERMTGGGSVIDDPPGNPQVEVTGKNDPLAKVTHGFEIHCGAPPETPNNLEINWPGNHFHLENLTMGTCVCNPAFLPPDNPDAGFNEFIGAGTGKLNGLEGASITFIFTDQGEPGTNDTEQITILDPAGAVVLSFKPTNITFGNQQAHREGGAKVPPCTL